MLQQIDEYPEKPRQELIAMRTLISKSVAVVAISLASFPAFAMDSLVIERFYIQNQEPLNTGPKDARSSSLQRVIEDSDSRYENLKKVEIKNHDKLYLHGEGGANYIDK
ncbi:hypothetical protein BTW10_03185 [Chromohalobacter japonicus]|uniref:Uncharacterized protein n=1 Tax=Chromohalobacter japonicus TaxID=223900 RepID=A0A1Q8TFM0_9GAMM|nr:hypothetical protein [Chromohalobacter japonicus]OLO12487.1 hypothetical protein BTW10_03185 [Chromohalobacter japonicus]